MLTTIISDNYYFLAGIESNNILPIYLSNNSDICDVLMSSILGGNVIIAVECIRLRVQIIEVIRSQITHYYVLMPEILKNRYFKIGEVIFASMNLTTQFLNHITTIKTTKPGYLLTLRESQVLDFFYLKNNSIARILALSEKTISAYRRSILVKFKLDTANHMAMIRIQKSIAHCNIQHHIRGGAC